MSGKPFDVSIKDLVELAPLAWAEWLYPGPMTGAAFVDADLSTVTAAADKVLRVNRTRGDLLVNLEAESGHAGDAPDKALFYSSLLRRRHGLPVRSVVLLMRPEANATDVTGRLELRENPEDGEPYLVFRYHVVRVWQQPLETILSGPVGLLPLAPLTDEAAGGLQATVERVVARPEAETPPGVAGKMVEAAFILMGLRYTVEVIRGVVERSALVRDSGILKDNNFVKYLLAEGEERGVARGIRESIVRFGQDALGPAGPETVRALEAIADIDRLRTLADRLRKVSTWDELLAE